MDSFLIGRRPGLDRSEEFVVKMSRIILGFAPLLVYGLAGQWVAPSPAALIGAGAALVLIIVGAFQDGVTILPVVQAVILVAIAVIAYLDQGAQDFLGLYGRGLAGFALGIFILATIRVFPFTQQMSRRAVPEQYWGAPAFVGMNRMLSSVWGLVVLTSGVANVLAGALTDAGAAPALVTTLRLGIPLLTIGVGLKMTSDIAAAARQRHTATAQLSR